MVVSDLYHRVSYVTFRGYKLNSQSLLIGKTPGQTFRCFGRIQIVLETSNQACVVCLVISILMLHCRFHTLIWVVELYCVVDASCTMPHSFFEVRRCVVRHTLKSDVNEFLPCSWKYVLLMSWCFNFDDFPLIDKLTDIKIEPSTWLVESRDWFSAKQPCISSVSRIGTIS